MKRRKFIGDVTSYIISSQIRTNPLRLLQQNPHLVKYSDIFRKGENNSFYTVLDWFNTSINHKETFDYFKEIVQKDPWELDTTDTTVISWAFEEFSEWGGETILSNYKLSETFIPKKRISEYIIFMNRIWGTDAGFVGPQTISQERVDYLTDICYAISHSTRKEALDSTFDYLKLIKEDKLHAKPFLDRIKYTPGIDPDDLEEQIKRMFSMANIRKFLYGPTPYGFKIPPYCRTTSCDAYFLSTSTAGKRLPESNSKLAPPPVEI